MQYGWGWAMCARQGRAQACRGRPGWGGHLGQLAVARAAGSAPTPHPHPPSHRKPERCTGTPAAPVTVTAPGAGSPDGRRILLRERSASPPRPPRCALGPESQRPGRRLSAHGAAARRCLPPWLPAAAAAGVERAGVTHSVHRDEWAPCPARCLPSVRAPHCSCSPAAAVPVGLGFEA